MTHNRRVSRCPTDQHAFREKQPNCDILEFKAKKTRKGIYFGLKILI